MGGRTAGFGAGWRRPVSLRGTLTARGWTDSAFVRPGWTEVTFTRRVGRKAPWSGVGVGLGLPPAGPRALPPAGPRALSRALSRALPGALPGALPPAGLRRASGGPPAGLRRRRPAA